jgi:hypothetical protein
MFKISGATFALTGNFTELIRKKLTEAIEAEGGTIHAAVNRLTKTLITGGGLDQVTNKLRMFREIKARFKPKLIPASGGGFALSGTPHGILTEGQFIALAPPKLIEICKLKIPLPQLRKGRYGFDFRVGGHGPIRFGPAKHQKSDVLNFAHYYSAAQVDRGKRMASNAERWLSP